jgi:hypothetical protein
MANFHFHSFGKYHTLLGIFNPTGRRSNPLAQNLTVQGIVLNFELHKTKVPYSLTAAGVSEITPAK